MSYHARVPAALSPAVVPFDLTTAQVRSDGTLIFASAGNGGQNIDARETVLGIPLWEKAWYTPAENNGVIAVGALAYDSQTRAPFSNFGTEQLDIYAPGVIELGPDPSNPGNIVQITSGTSIASPFAAGVAALIWAANPNLDADGVESILYETAVQNPVPGVNRYVNALDAVLATLGDVPPYLKIIGPADGSSFSRGNSVPLVADREDYEDGLLDVVWTSDRDGVIGSSPATLSYGTHVITATVTDSAGQTATDSITIEITNDAPEVHLITPLPGATLYTGNPIQFSATSHDINEPSQMLPDSAMVWTSSIDGFLGTGHDLVTALSAGDHEITVVGTDSQGALAGVQINVHVVDPVGGIPQIVFLVPVVEDPSEVVIFLTGADEDGWFADVRLVANVTDPEDGQLHGDSLVWSIGESEFGPFEPLGDGDSLSVRLYVDDPTGDVLFIRLTATDSDGQEVSLTLTVRLFGFI
jgi:serine protease